MTPVTEDDDVKFAKRWATVQVPAVTVGQFKEYVVFQADSWMPPLKGGSYLFAAEAAAWSALAAALKPVRESLGPVIEAGVVERAVAIVKRTAVSIVARADADRLSEKYELTLRQSAKNTAAELNDVALLISELAPKGPR